MKRWVRRMSVVAASLTMAGGALAPSASAVEVLAWDCPLGFSCYYDKPFGEDLIFVAPHAGCNVLSSAVANRISSVYNGGGGTVHLYDRSPCTGELLTSIVVGQRDTMDPPDDNKANSVFIDPP